MRPHNTRVTRPGDDSSRGRYSEESKYNNRRQEDGSHHSPNYSPQRSSYGVGHNSDIYTAHRRMGGSMRSNRSPRYDDEQRSSQTHRSHHTRSPPSPRTGRGRFGRENENEHRGNIHSNEEQLRTTRPPSHQISHSIQNEEAILQLMNLIKDTTAGGSKSTTNIPLGGGGDHTSPLFQGGPPTDTSFISDMLNSLTSAQSQMKQEFYEGGGHTFRGEADSSSSGVIFGGESIRGSLPPVETSRTPINTNSKFSGLGGKEDMEVGEISMGEGGRGKGGSSFNNYVITNLSKYYNVLDNIVPIPAKATRTVYVEGIPCDASEREVSRRCFMWNMSNSFFLIYIYIYMSVSSI